MTPAHIRNISIPKLNLKIKIKILEIGITLVQTKLIGEAPSIQPGNRSRCQVYEMPSDRNYNLNQHNYCDLIAFT